MNPLQALHQHGQSFWLDYIRRSLMTNGELERLIEDDGLRGVTSNPTIFQKAVAGSNDYDEVLREALAADRHADTGRLYEALAIGDIRLAADILRPLYDRSEGGDGFVSLEVSPALAHDTAGTLAEARRLWLAVDRPNLMIKVPATPAGIPAVAALIAEGINVNVTLLFSLGHYDAVARAYLHGLERAPDPANVASVASFFVSRVDAAVDAALEKIGSPDAQALRGKVAIANAKAAYRRFREIFGGERFAPLQARGARPQRVLWASTGVKNPEYSDVLYVEELIGADTVNTMPPATMNAFRDHGRVAPLLERGLDEAEATLGKLAALGIDLDAVTTRLQKDGVASFAESFEQLLATLKEKRSALLASRVVHHSMSLGAYEDIVDARVATLRKERAGQRIWKKDPTVWFEKPVEEIAHRLGWLTLPEDLHEQVDDLEGFAAEVVADGIRQVVLLGMGGSSLAPQVFASTFGSAPGHPELIVLDSTHPEAVLAVERRLDVPRTLFLISSKSGTTLETLSLFRTFWDRAKALPDRGRHFVAITDPGTPLETLARERGFRRVFRAPPDVGGRYAALSVFGLVPAALLGIDVHRLLDRAWTMAEAGAFCVEESCNPALMLGATLGELTRAGRDKVTFLTSPGLAAFPGWLEQLLAESTGKDGKGIIPVADEPAGEPGVYANDRFFVVTALEGEGHGALDARVDALEKAGHPVARFSLTEKADLAQEMYRWEFATAVAGAVLGIHPFNQPDVQLAKDLARQAMAGERGGAEGGDDEPTDATSEPDALTSHVARWIEGRRPGDYVVLQAYLAPGDATDAALQAIRSSLRDRWRLATTVGYGPRFLHSTGQLHKGGPDTGLFLQLVDEPGTDVAVPETDYTLGALIRAQALGDYRALRQRHRRVLRVNLGRDVAEGLTRLAEALGLGARVG